jgi:hypothetical protein
MKAKKEKEQDKAKKENKPKKKAPLKDVSGGLYTDRSPFLGADHRLII